MKNFSLLILAFFCFVGSMNAQMKVKEQSQADMFADFRQYLSAKAQMDFRNATIEALDLNEDEINSFDFFYTSYTAEGDKYYQRKKDLIKRFREEMKEDDSVANQNEDRADYIEDFLEIEIDESEDRKDAYDKLEDKIGLEKTMQFFIWDDAFNRYASQDFLSMLLPESVVNGQLQIEMQPADSKVKVADKNVSDEDYKRYIDSKMKVDMRNTMVKALDLNDKESARFTSAYMSYMKDKEALLERRMDLLEDLREELAEDDDFENEQEDRADFIEDYWEIINDGAELKKDQFDRLEDIIGVDKAAKFYLYEDAVENRLMMNSLMSIVPQLSVLKIYEIEMQNNNRNNEMSATSTFSKGTQQKINGFVNWVNNTKRNGEVNVYHDYTRSGLMSLTNALEAMQQDKNIEIAGFSQKISVIRNNANEITKNWKETDHADLTSEAFIAAAEIINAMGKMKNDSRVMQVAKNLKSSEMLTDQAPIIYNFFDAAKDSLQKLNGQKTSDKMMKTDRSDK